MRLIVFIGLGLLGVTGCSRKVAPVSSTKEIHTEKTASDSLVTSKTDSFSHIETVTEKTLPASTVGLSLSRAQLDSLVNALQAMPSVSRTIVMPDKVGRAQLKILMDSIGNVQFLCTSLEKTYFEKNVQQTHLIESLTVQLTKVNEQLSIKEKEIVELKKGFFARVGDWAQNFALNICLIIIILGIVVILFRQTIGRIPFIKKFLS